MSAASAGGITALILAGRREGAIDPLAASRGVALKCLVPVAGRPMILHVLGAVAQCPQIGRVIVSTNDMEEVARLAEMRTMLDSGRLTIVDARRNLADSVLSALAGARYPVIVTTADNVNLTAAAALQIDADARAAGADVAVAFARRSAVLAAHSDGQRRFYTFSDDAYSNCNSYWIGSRKALRIVELFRQGGQFAKFPMRIVRAFGLLNLIRFRFGIGTLEAAFGRFSRRFRLELRPVILSDGAIAIDVDNERTLRVAEELLNRRPPA